MKYLIAGFIWIGVFLWALFIIPILIRTEARLSQKRPSNQREG